MTRSASRLIRRGQPCTATPAGERLARHAEALTLLEKGLATDLKGMASQPAACLRLAVNADSLATWLLPALAAVPDLLFDLVVDDQDHSADWLRRGEVLAAVTAAGRAVAGCDSHALGSLRYLATASPAFVARHFEGGVTADTLSRAPTLVFNAKDRLQRDWMAALTGQTLDPPGHRIASSQGFVDAALLGLGWGMNPAVLVQGHIAAGRLIELRPDSPMNVALCWQVARVTAPSLAGLTQAIRQAAAQVLTP